MSKKRSNTIDLNQTMKEEKKLEKFLNICKQEWRRIHYSEIKKKGRPSQKDLIWTACDNAVSGNKLHSPFTQQKVIDKIQDDVGTISGNTLLTHVKAWINEQIMVVTPGQITKGQLYWLQKNNPKEYDLLMGLKEPEVIEYIKKDLPIFIEKVKKTIDVYKKIHSGKITEKEKQGLEKQCYDLSLIQYTLNHFLNKAT